MGIAINLILWVHLVSVALAGSTAFSMPLLRRMAAQAEPAHRPVFMPIMAKLAALGRMALVLLILSGLALLWTKYTGFSGQNGWFHLKMLLVVLLSALAIFSIYNARWAAAGDAAAISRRATLSRLVTSLVMAIILAAVFAFN
jgi:putative membrane protein